MKHVLLVLIALGFVSFRDDPKELVLRAHATYPHPEVVIEFNDQFEFWNPEVCLLQIETRDGKNRFFVRAARTSYDAAMMFRTEEPKENQLRRR